MTDWLLTIKLEDEDDQLARVYAQGIANRVGRPVTLVDLRAPAEDLPVPSLTFEPKP